jgi:hypothetical protein
MRGQKNGAVLAAPEGKNKTWWMLRASVLVIKPQSREHSHEGEYQGRDRGAVCATSQSLPRKLW